MKLYSTHEDDVDLVEIARCVLGIPPFREEPSEPRTTITEEDGLVEEHA